MWRGELRAVISQFAFTLWTLWNDDVLGSCYWLVSGTWTLLCDACRRPESPLKKIQGKWESNVAGKKSSLLGLQPEVAFTMNEMRRCRPGNWNKVAVVCCCSCFQIRSKSETSSAVVHKKTYMLVPCCDPLRIPDCTVGLGIIFLTSSSSEAVFLWNCGLCRARCPPQHKRWPNHRCEHLKSLNWFICCCLMITYIWM